MRAIKRNKNRLKVTKAKRTRHGLSSGNFVRNTRRMDKSQQRMNVLIRGIISFIIVAVIAISLAFIFVYLIPLLQSEFGVDSGSESSDLSSSEVQPIMEYDALGLPIYDNEFSLFVINSRYPSEDYAPETEKVNGIFVDKKIATSVKMMVSDAKDDGLLLEFVQGYTSFNDQEALYQERVNELMEHNGLSLIMARTDAQETVPVAGESDYQTGLTIRLTGDNETFQTSKTYEWLNKNMAKYGFTFRYPTDSSKKTGLKDNMTVIRYVGAENADRMRQLSMSLEEYISYLNSQ